MRFASTFFTVACLVFLVSGCSGGVEGKGGEGQPCYSNGTCDEGLECNDSNVCEKPSAGVCDGVTCSGHGTCEDNQGQPLCNCDTGYHREGLECIENDPNCVDNDGDGHGENCTLGPDCDDTSADHWDDCGTCVDNDGDGYGAGCNLGGDCDDTDDTKWNACDDSAILTWNAPTQNADGTPLTDLAGYRVYWGTTSGTYANTIDVGNVTNHTLQGLASGTWYFAVTAYDTSNNESTFSNEASKAIP